MTLIEARASLKRTVQASIEPILTDVEIDEILAAHLRYSTYAASTAYVVGDRVRLSGSSDNGRIYRCTIGGTSAASDATPDFPDSNSAVMGQKISDGETIIWQDDGADRIGPYDLRGAEKDCWMLKASKVASNVDFSDSGQSLKASQEATEYRRRANLCSGVWVF
jgi:hypothetical protein